MREQREQREHDGRTRLIGSHRARTWGVALIGTAFIVAGAAMVWLSPGGGAGLRQGTGQVRTETGRAGSNELVLGTSGQDDLPGDNSGPGLTTIHEVETITGATDGHQLVGRRVDLHVPVQEHLNDVAFWVGPRDNRLLVVLARDDRDGETRQLGGPAGGISRTMDGTQATISGTIQRVPYAEAMYSWGLTNADRDELMDRRIYLRADRVSANRSPRADAGAVGTAGEAAPDAAPDRTLTAAP
jgi:hypothetical protein